MQNVGTTQRLDTPRNDGDVGSFTREQAISAYTALRLEARMLANDPEFQAGLGVGVSTPQSQELADLNVAMRKLANHLYSRFGLSAEKCADDEERKPANEILSGAIADMEQLKSSGVTQQGFANLLKGELAPESGNSAVAQTEPSEAVPQTSSAQDLMRVKDAALAATLPALIRLGDFVGNVDNGGASGLGHIDRCAIIRQVRAALAAPNADNQQKESNYRTRTVVLATSAYAVIETPQRSMDVRLEAGRSAAKSLRESVAEMREKAARINRDADFIEAAIPYFERR